MRKNSERIKEELFKQNTKGKYIFEQHKGKGKIECTRHKDLNAEAETK
jgi:hypothetical protein